MKAIFSLYCVAHSSSALCFTQSENHNLHASLIVSPRGKKASRNNASKCPFLQVAADLYASMFFVDQFLYLLTSFTIIKNHSSVVFFSLKNVKAANMSKGNTAHF